MYTELFFAFAMVVTVGWTASFGVFIWAMAAPNVGDAAYFAALWTFVAFDCLCLCMGICGFACNDD